MYAVLRRGFLTAHLKCMRIAFLFGSDATVVRNGWGMNIVHESRHVSECGEI